MSGPEVVQPQVSGTLFGPDPVDQQSAQRVEADREIKQQVRRRGPAPARGVGKPPFRGGSQPGWWARTENQTGDPKAGATAIYERGRVTQDPPGKIRTGSYPSFKWVTCEACAGNGCLKCGKCHRSTGITYTWLACDRCGGLSLLRCTAPDQGRLDDPDYRKKRGRPCRMSPGCAGRHVISDPTRGRI